MSGALDILGLPLRGTQLIEASAGTGKTHCILWLYLRCIVEGNFSVGQVLVVTFTEAATAELKRRLVAHLQRVLSWLEIPATQSVNAAEIVSAERLLLLRWLQQLAELGIGRGLAIERIALAIAELELAAIHTIHGFCRRVLSDCALETRSAFVEFELGDADELRRLAVADFWRERVLSAGPASAAWALRCWSGPPRLFDVLRPVMGRPDTRFEPAALQDELASNTAELARASAQVVQLWGQSDEVFALLKAEEFGLSKDKKTGYGDARLRDLQRELHNWISAADFAVPPPIELVMLQPALLAARQKDAWRKSGKPLPKHALLSALGRLAEIVELHQTLSRAALLKTALGFVQEFLRRRERESHSLGFDALIGRVWSALHGAAAPALAGLLLERYPIAMVDEFQDTDQAQYAIFRRIYVDRGTLIAIGDPKQAIYGFRGGDIYAYGQARLDAGANRHSLPDNYRSEPALCAALNRIFSARAQAFGHDFIAFEPVAARGPKDGRRLTEYGSALPPLRFWHATLSAELQDGRSKQPLASAGKLVPAICAAVAGEIVRLLSAGQAGTTRLGERTLVASDIAVLVRSHGQGESTAAALRARGVASVRKGNASVFASPEAEDLALVLGALLEPTGGGRLRAALATELLGGEVLQPENPLQRERWQELLAVWAERRRNCEVDGPLALLTPLLRDAAPRLLRYSDGERRMTNLRHLAELLEAQRARYPRLEDLHTWFQAQREGANGRIETQQLRVESDNDAVQILTVHGSKGLEFPVVFAPFLWSSASAREWEPPLVAHDAACAALIDLGSASWPGRARAAQRDTFYEEVRLTYVALTRAINRLYIVWGKVAGAERSALAWLLHGGDYTPPEAHPGWSALDDRAIAETLQGYCADAPGGDPAASAGTNTIDAGMLYQEMPTDRLASLPALIRSAPLAARSFVGRIVAAPRVQSFSALARGDTRVEVRDHDRQAVELNWDLLSAEDSMLQAGRDEIAAAAAGLRGPALGEALHAVLEQLDVARDADKLSVLIAEQRRRAGLLPSAEALLRHWVGSTLGAEILPRLRLAELSGVRRIAELEFHFALDAGPRAELLRLARQFPDYAEALALLGDTGERLDGWMHGFVDLLFEHQGRYYVLDYKSNWLGERAEDYAQARLVAAMRDHRYDLQALIYLVAAHRHLAGCLGDGYSIEQHLGDGLWLFVRGLALDGRSGVCRVHPPPALLLALDGWLGTARGKPR